jgi:hypothetical protein
MSRDIDAVLRGWEYRPEVVQAKITQAGDRRQVILMRVDLGVLQLETAGRPDGGRPHGFPTYFDYLRHQAARIERDGGGFTLSEAQCQEADREFVQYYQRRICWLSLRQYTKAVADADHTLELMDFVRDHSPNEDYTLAHEQYRGFVLFHRTQAAAAGAAERDDPEGAVDAIRAGLARLRDFFADHEVEERMEEDGMVRQLRKMERSLRELHQLGPTLQEQLESAVRREDYEEAARLRDALRHKE